MEKSSDKKIEFARELIDTHPVWPYISPLATIHPNVELRGENITIHPHASVGSDGFGFVTIEHPAGNIVWHHHEYIPHTGPCIIEDEVEIFEHANICRGTVAYTKIGFGTKIDTYVHVAHNVKIGKRCLIISHSVIGGSVVIGDEVYVGMGAMIKNKIHIGDCATIGMGAVVLKDVPAGETWVGNPAKPLKK